MVNSTTMDAVLAIQIPQKGRQDPRMTELICFLLCIGAAATYITVCVKVHRENIVSSSRHIGTSKLAHTRADQRPPETILVGQDAGKPTPVFSTAAHNTNYARSNLSKHYS